MSEKRDPQQTKDIGIKKLKDAYEKQNQKACSPDQVRKFEKLYEKEILPNVYKK